MGNIPKQVEKIIYYLNNRRKIQLEELHITNITLLIKVFRQMLMKQTLLKITQINVKSLVADINDFMSMFDTVIKLRFPHPWDGNE